jgi:hypothetical protein
MPQKHADPDPQHCCLTQLQASLLLLTSALLETVLQIHEVYPGSQIRIFPSRIQGQKGTGSRTELSKKQYYVLKF